MQQLPRTFYARPARTVAPALLGQKLVRQMDDGSILAGRIVETEAYCDADQPDLACHATRNRGRPTPRTTVMFGPPGHAYVYFTYGIHWLFNIVTGATGQANAVLVRALEPLAGEPLMARHRDGRPRPQWTNGPAKLTQALAITGSLHGADLCASDAALWIEQENNVALDQICTGPRIGLGQTPEPWYSAPWRYWIKDNAFVSK